MLTGIPSERRGHGLIVTLVCIARWIVCFTLGMKMKDSVHEKAIRLLEGGIVEVDGHSVSLVVIPDSIDTCYHCEMDCLCHTGTEMCDVCIECVEISKKNCILELVTLDSILP